MHGQAVSTLKGQRSTLCPLKLVSNVRRNSKLCQEESGRFCPEFRHFRTAPRVVLSNTAQSRQHSTPDARVNVSGLALTASPYSYPNHCSTALNSRIRGFWMIKKCPASDTTTSALSVVLSRAKKLATFSGWYPASRAP